MRVFDIGTSKSAPRLFFSQHLELEICFSPQWRAKSGPKLIFFVRFQLKMCFSPQRRAIFRHRNFKKWSEADVFCTCSVENVLLAVFRHRKLSMWSEADVFCKLSLANVLIATAACNFFDIGTSKSGPMLMCFVHFHLKMCFS